MVYYIHDEKQTIIFDVDGTIADCEHRRHFVDGTDSWKDWKSFREQTKFDTPVQWVCDIAKDTLHLVMMLHSSLQETNLKGTLQNNRFLNGLGMTIKGCS